MNRTFPGAVAGQGTDLPEGTELCFGVADGNDVVSKTASGRLMRFCMCECPHLERRPHNPRTILPAGNPDSCFAWSVGKAVELT